MIKSISITNVPPFGAAAEALDELSQFNFLFGSNGTGKTVISRVLADEASFPSCKVTWAGGTRLEVMVYNHDFVERHFYQVPELKGVFTLGEDQVDTLTKIATAKAELDDLTSKIDALTNTLQGVDGDGGKKGDLSALELTLRNKCWAQKQKHDAKLRRGFEGYRGSAEKFKGKVLKEMDSNSATALTVAELGARAESVFGSNPTAEPAVAAVETTRLLAHEAHPILKTRVIGREDVDIAAMIKKLGNNDWVGEGRAFYDFNNQVCPFCQQVTTEAFARSLSEYFDETFIADKKAIDELATKYSTDAARLQQQLAAIIAMPSSFLDLEKLTLEKQLLDANITLNNQRLAEKRKEASQVVELESLEAAVGKINSLVESANAQVASHNQMVANLSAERSTLTAQVWKLVLEELNGDLADFRKAKDRLNKANASLTEHIAEALTTKERKAAEIRSLERQTTSVQPTIDGINALLVSFGFQSFKLAKASDGTSYRLVRPDGSDAKATLSEGEKTFVTFLYFFHLLKGSKSDSGMTVNRIVVCDDPVSSLDSEILFIVSSLIKGLFDEVRMGTGHVKQVFVFTHNVYFHKEVTFNARRNNDEATREETFWIVRKSNAMSKLEKHASNPIKTSYELLWAEVRRQDRSNLTIQNVLRRILDNYFKILGGYDYTALCDLFSGQEKLMCKSLVSWVNDGSHFAYDDLYLAIDDTMVDAYLEVFREIFKRTGNAAHYKMMMGEAYVEEGAAAAQA